MRRRVASLLVLAAATAAAPVAAQKSLVFEHFHADVEVLPEGDLLVTETLRPRFTGQWNGVLRLVDLQHTTAAGQRERLDFRFISATDGQGRPLRAEVDAPDASTREIRVWVPNARDRTADVTIRYRVGGALRYFEAAPDPARDGAPARDYDEVYWQVTGTDWDVPIERASARVRLPSGAMPLQAAAYEGRPASGRQVEVGLPGGGTDVPPGEVVVPSSGRLDPGEGLTVAVAWPAGHVAMPAGVQRSQPVRFGPDGSVRDAGDGPTGSPGPVAWLPLLLPFLAFGFAYRVWKRRGRDPKERAVAVRWEPPAELAPAEAGTLVDHDPGMHDIISTLVDLAVRGYVVIAEREKKGFLEFGKDYVFHLVRPRSEWTDLTRHESLFLNGLFEHGSRSSVLANLAREGSMLDDLIETVAGEPASESAPAGAIESVALSDLQNRFYKKIPPIKDALLDSLVRKGYYLRRPDRARARWLLMAGGAFMLGFGAIPAIATETATGFVFGATLMGASFASALILAVFAFYMPARTTRGARTREAALGFKRFLERVESPRYRRMIRSPDQFEQYLPFAMAFRCADEWAEAFDDLLTEPPDWYHGRHGAFRPTIFASDLGTLASTASSAMASSPSSSGSGGGGSVGGGSGGGGGGGF